MPMISNAPSALTSPTMATTLLVPMSRPTIRLRSERLAISGACGRRLGSAPADGEAVGIAHVHVRDVVQAMRNHLGRRSYEAIEPRVDVAACEPYRDAAVQIHLPRAALVQTQRGDAVSSTTVTCRLLGKRRWTRAWSTQGTRSTARWIRSRSADMNPAWVKGATAFSICPGDTR